MMEDDRMSHAQSEATLHQHGALNGADADDATWKQNAQQQQQAPAVASDEDWGEVIDARPILPKAAFFMGDLRDGLPMVR